MKQSMRNSKNFIVYLIVNEYIGILLWHHFVKDKAHPIHLGDNRSHITTVKSTLLSINHRIYLDTRSYQIIASYKSLYWHIIYTHI